MGILRIDPVATFDQGYKTNNFPALNMIFEKNEFSPFWPLKMAVEPKDGHFKLRPH